MALSRISAPSVETPRKTVESIYGGALKGYHRDDRDANGGQTGRNRAARIMPVYGLREMSVEIEEVDGAMYKLRVNRG